MNFLRQRTEAKGAWESPGHEVDRQLAERIGKGDREALSLLLDRHLSAVYGYLARRLGPGHEETAAQVTCATFEAALRRLRPYAQGSAPTPMQLWLIREAGNQLAHVSKRGNIEEPGPPTDGGEVPTDGGEVPTGRGEAPTGSRGEACLAPTKMRAIINALPPRKGAVLALTLFEGMSPQEIAAASGVSISRAMRLLRVSLKYAGAAIESQVEAESQHE